MASFIGLLRAFLRWWLAELAGCVPTQLKRRLARRSDAIVLALEGNRVAVHHEAGGGSARPLGTLELERAEASPLLRKLRRGKLPVCLRLPAERGLVTEIALPLAVEENLDQVLRFELDRRTPFSPAAAHFAHRIVRRDAAAGQLILELVVVPRPVVSAAMATIGRLGLKPDRVEVAASTTGAPASGNLLDAAASSGRRTRFAGIAAAAAASAAAAYAGFVVYTTHHDALAWQSRLQSAQRMANRAADAQAEVAKLQAAKHFLLARKQERRSVSELLDNLSRNLPDDTYLTELTLKANDVRMVGLSGGASGLIGVVGRSGAFAEPSFPAAVTFDPTAGRERFELIAKVTLRGAP